MVNPIITWYFVDKEFNLNHKICFECNFDMQIKLSQHKILSPPWLVFTQYTQNGYLGVLKSAVNMPVRNLFTASTCCGSGTKPLIPCSQ